LVNPLAANLVIGEFPLGPAWSLWRTAVHPLAAADKMPRARGNPVFQGTFRGLRVSSLGWVRTSDPGLTDR
jgi:hypothetical protein